MLISTASFAIMNACIKQVSHLPAMEIVLFRCGISAAICLWILKHSGIDWRGSNRKLLILRGLFGTLALYTFFITLKHLPLGTAVTIQYLSPIFTTIIAIFLLTEPVKWVQWIFFAVSFAGVVWLKGFDTSISTSHLFIGILSALASGVAYNLVRSLKAREHAIVVVLHFQLTGTLIGGVFSAGNWVSPNGTDWLYLIVIGLTTQTGQMNLTYALQKEKMADVTILNYLGVIYAMLLGVLFFGEVYSVYSLAGIGLILAGVLLNFLYTSKAKKLAA